LIGHIHTAGDPGRCEPGETQELNYQPIIPALFETSYEDYEGQKFIPTRNPMESFQGTRLKTQDSGLRTQNNISINPATPEYTGFYSRSCYWDHELAKQLFPYSD
jgi:hypothetical protein